MDAEAFARAGLYDPAQPDADARLDLLNHLAARGVTIDEMVDAQRRGRLRQAASDLLAFVVDDPTTLPEMAERTGTSVELIARIRLALGLPTDADSTVSGAFAELLASFQAGVEIFGVEPILSFSRVIGEASARVAQAALDLFTLELQPQFTTDVEVAEAAERAIAGLGLIPVVAAGVINEHLTLTRRRAASVPETNTPGEAAGELVAVGFVDLVDSTAWAERLSLIEHAAALARFERSAWNLTVEQGGRLVKLIGDEVMFVAPTVLDATTIALGICRAAAADADLPAARGAIGFGPALSRDGDYFGPLVNVVSRCVKLAPPGGVVLTGEARSRVDATPHAARPHLEEFGTHRVRGVDTPVELFVSR
jgi:adenylate cyclase